MDGGAFRQMKAMLLRVGIYTGYGGTLGLIFEDGSFFRRTERHATRLKRVNYEHKSYGSGWNAKGVKIRRKKVCSKVESLLVTGAYL
jgi:hypothetical protein